MISNVLPQAPASQATTVAATQSAFAAAQAAAASRPLTPVAVSAAGAATAYSTQMPERRTVTAQRSNQQASQPQSSRPAILPDPEFWKVPTRPAGEQIAPLPARQQLIDHIQQAAQYTAQAAAQEAPAVVKQPQQQQQQQQQTAANARRFNALLAKQPGVGDSSGLGAYTIAAQRSVQMSLPPTVEAVI